MTRATLLRQDDPSPSRMTRAGALKYDHLWRGCGLRVVARRVWRRARNMFHGGVRRHGASAAASAAFLALIPSAAFAQGLDRARTVLQTFQTQLTTIIPIAAALILLVIGISYAGNFIEKDTFVRWGVGTIIAGSAVQITAMLFGS